ncbi:nuclear envelope integral membrane protein isoform X2 [Plodia interpunctella]|uniref:nuclear envelope integral membrane protein isoform X2 n=1 Tax=Plodia interpunctella TaxID=58824 RepID=UPI0023683DEF|nr:nuclear envelope integral membrane protein isoform X2 [Plodia interpunctella]
MGSCERWITLLLFPCLFTIVVTLPYDVHWLGGATTIERDIPMPKQALDIYCYPGTNKNLFAIWQTVKFHLRIKNDEFRQYLGTTPEDVYKQYTEDYGWTVNPFQIKSAKSTTLSLFTPTCMAVNTKQRHIIELQVIRVDIWRIILMLAGVTLILSSKALSGNPVFFYLCGIFVGVFASFLVLVYYVSKLVPGKKALTYGVLIGGWTVGVYIWQQVWENTRGLLVTHHSTVMWYLIAASFASLLVCYRIGPPRNARTKNMVMWTLQAAGVVMVFSSSSYQDAAGAVIVLSLLIKYFPRSLLLRIQGYWRRKFPPKPRLLTNEEYYEQGARETKHALENLRKYCSSPDCAQWNIMLKLNDSRRKPECRRTLEISDDDSSDYEEL